MFVFFAYFKKTEIPCTFEKYTPLLTLMRKMFSRGVLSVAVCIGVGTGSLKADFDADLQSVLSIESRGFSEEVFDPMYWIKACTDLQEAEKADKNLQEADKLYGDLRKVYEAYEELYEKFGTGVREIESGFTAKMMSVTAEDPDAFAERAFCLLQLSRDLYGKVFNYSDWAWKTLVADEDGEWMFKNVDPLILLECFYVFERRVLGLSRYAIQHHITKTDYINTKDREPNSKVLADILKSFAKKEAYEELALGKIGKNDSTLVQKNNIFMKTFLEFSRKNKGTLEGAKKTFGTPSAKSWFEVLEPGKELDYLNYLTMQPRNFIDALRTLSRDASACVTRMTEIKVPAELKKEALQFFKGEKDVGELLKAAESFRMKEKAERKRKQEAFAESKKEWEELKIEITKTKNMLKSKKRELNEISENGTKISDKKEKLEQEVQQLGQEVQQLKKTIETLKKQINKLSYLSMKTKRKMQRKAAKEGIKKEERDAAVFTNYVQLPGRCGALLNAFLYYQTIMWNVFTDGINVTKGYGRRIYDELKIKEPELTDDFEEEYHNLAKSI